MKTKLNYTPIALAVMALMAAPAFANGYEGGDGYEAYWDLKADLLLEANDALALNTSETEVTLKKTVDNTKAVDTVGTIEVRGVIDVDSSSMAIINDRQVNYRNDVENNESTNSATLSGDVLKRGAGNIGVNIAAGDNNQQANAAALAAADASFVFGSADSEVFAYQHAEHNQTSNLGQTNLASLAGNVAKSAAGNIGVNIAAGNSNQQKNDLAMSVAVSRMAEASVAVTQISDHNSTSNMPIHKEEVQWTPIKLSLNASGGYWGIGGGGYAGSTGGSYSGKTGGSYSGTSDQIGDVYPDMWNGAKHPGGPSRGHFDLDTQTQGGSDLNNDGGALAFRNDGTYSGSEKGSYSGSESGGLGFYEAGYQELAGTVSGRIPVVVTTNLATTNTASLGGSVLACAAGNIGVNIAAGSGNQQYNGLAIAATQAGTGNGGGGGE